MKAQTVPENKKPDVIYTVVFILALACSLLLIVRMLLLRDGAGNAADLGASSAPSQVLQTHSKAAENQDGALVRLTGSQAAAILAAAMPESFPIDGIVVSFEEGQAHITGNAHRDGVIQYLEENGTELSPLLRASLSLLPEETKLGMVFELPHMQEGIARLKPVSISIGSILLDAAFLPESLTSALNDAINDEAAVYGGILSRVYIEGDMLILEFDV